MRENNSSNGWQIVRLEDIADVILGGTPSTKVDEYWNPADIDWVTAKDVSNFPIAKINYSERKISRKGLENSSAKVLPALTTVIIARGATMGKVRMLARPMAINQTCYGIVAKNNSVDPIFLYYYFRNLYAELRNVAHGSVFDTVTRSTLNPLKIQLPSISEQRSIARILGTLDDKIDLNRRMNATLESIARAIFKSWFLDFDPVRAKLDGRNAGLPHQVAALFPDRFDETGLGKIPRGWKIVQLTEILDILSGGTPKTSISEYWGGDINWISAKDVSNNLFRFILDTERKITAKGLEDSSTKILPRQTTVITARGTVGNICLLGKEMAMNQTNYGLKAKKGIGDYYVFFVTANLIGALQQASYGTIFDTITTRTLQDSLILHPSIDLICAYEKTVSSFMDQILQHQLEIQTLSYLRDLLLPKLMRGEIPAK